MTEGQTRIERTISVGRRLLASAVRWLTAPKRALNRIGYWFCDVNEITLLSPEFLIWKEGRRERQRVLELMSSFSYRTKNDVRVDTSGTRYVSVSFTNDEDIAVRVFSEKLRAKGFKTLIDFNRNVITIFWE